MEKSLEQIVKRLLAAYRDSDRSALVDYLHLILEHAKGVEVEPTVAYRYIRSWSASFPLRREEWSTLEAALADLTQGLFDLAPRPKTKFRDKLRKRANWIFDHYAAAAGIAIAAATALYGLAYARFYDALNTTPSRVGVTTTDILVSSATGGFALAALIAVALFLAAAPIVPVLDEFEDEDKTGKWLPLVWLTFLNAMAALFLFGLVIEFNPPAVFVGFLIGVYLYAVKEAFKFRWKFIFPIPTPKPLNFQFDRYLVLAVIVIPISLVGTGVITVVEAGNLGEKASRGEAVRDPRVLRMPFLGVRAEPATIASSDPKLHDPSIPRCALYLGTANGQVVLYEIHPASTVQVPSTDVHLDLRRYQSTCKAGDDNLAQGSR